VAVAAHGRQTVRLWRGWGSGSLQLRRPSGRRSARPPRVSGGREVTRRDRRLRGDRRKPLGPPRSILEPFSVRQGPGEPGILCRTGARTSALQPPVVARLGAGNALLCTHAFAARSGQATRRLPRSCSHTGGRPSRALPSSRFPPSMPLGIRISRKPRSMARAAARSLLRSPRAHVLQPPRRTSGATPTSCSLPLGRFPFPVFRLPFWNLCSAREGEGYRLCREHHCEREDEVEKPVVLPELTQIADGVHPGDHAQHEQHGDR